MGFVHLYIVSHVIGEFFFYFFNKSFAFHFASSSLVASVKHLYFAVESKIFW